LLFERPDPATLLPMTQALVERIRRALLGRGMVIDGSGQEAIMDAFEVWTRTENLEERCPDRNRIDPSVLSFLETGPDAS
jgi:seryl-tRNA(Sec) selenium transferase